MVAQNMTRRRATVVFTLLFAIMLGVFLAVSFVTHNFTYTFASLITACIALVAMGSKNPKPVKDPVDTKKASRI
ncbi:hypothetical protein H0266_16320 [Halobacillus locisalis]|uniref:Uncharacterized protein n=1 Tax=Halobacillus locisalis TaxID=220753 RepID=A0A838CXH4_9BACI|nr:hypothetical protein [Halobacillus locisalis]MBA2176465.1 hypothetical protein [Halobacillus locisalis]